eukprot:g12204.t1
MYRAIAQTVLKLQPDVEYTILRDYLLKQNGNLKEYAWEDFFSTSPEGEDDGGEEEAGGRGEVEAGGRGEGEAGGRGEGEAGGRGEAEAGGEVGVRSREDEKTPEDPPFFSSIGVLGSTTGENPGRSGVTDLGPSQPKRLRLEQLVHSATGMERAADEGGEEEDDELDKNRKRPEIILNPFGALHIRSTDNVGRFRHSVCQYADKLDSLMRFYRPDIGGHRERERLLKTPGGWHNSLERLYEDGNLTPYSMHVKKKKEFSMTELLEGRFKNEKDYDDLQSREMLARKTTDLKSFKSGHLHKTAAGGENGVGTTYYGEVYGTSLETGNVGAPLPVYGSAAGRGAAAEESSAASFAEDAAEDSSPGALAPGHDEKAEQEEEFRGSSSAETSAEVPAPAPPLSPPPGAQLQQDTHSDEQDFDFSFDFSRNSTASWNIPTKIRVVFVATDNCTKLEDFQQCDAYLRNRWTLASFCRREKKGTGHSSASRSSSSSAEQQQAVEAEGFFRKKEHTSNHHSSERMARPGGKWEQDSELVDQLVEGEVDLSEAENIHYTAKMLDGDEWTHPKRGTGVQDLYRLYAEVILLSKATFAVGTFSSNLSRLVQVLRTQPQNTMLSLDMRWKPG